jgi:sugar-specific transcriptional regulator TrmB
MKERVRPLLSNVGFSPLETDVYVALLKEPGASGYRVAQVVGKSVGSIYKALDSLRVKGAVVANDSTRPTTYVALSIHEYMNARRRDLEVLETKIEQELEEVVAAQAQGGVYELNSVGQVYERCRDLLRSAQAVALLNIDARPLEELRAELIAAADRGVKVLVKTRAPVRIPGCGILAPGETQAGRVWTGDELGVAVDFREYVQAFLKDDGSGVEEAIWVRQPHLANQVCTLFQNDFALTKVSVMVQAGKDVKAISREMHRLTRPVEVPAPPGLIPHEWTLTDAKERARKRRAKEKQPPQPSKVTVRHIEYILVASSRTVTVESAGIPDPNQPPPDSKALPAPDPDTLIEPLY